MKLEDIKKAVKEIEEIKEDDEAAHMEQDDLYRSIIKAIAEGKTVTPEMAQEALKVEEIDFSRWYA